MWMSIVGSCSISKKRKKNKTIQKHAFSFCDDPPVKVFVKQEGKVEIRFMTNVRVGVGGYPQWGIFPLTLGTVPYTEFGEFVIS
jgi:5-deoxy-D-glucuronate isomerase